MLLNPTHNTFKTEASNVPLEESKVMAAEFVGQRNKGLKQPKVCGHQDETLWRFYKTSTTETSLKVLR